MKAAIYTRVSTDEQAREDKTSLASQLERCHQYCAAMGWEVVEVYEDAGVSGAKEERFKRMVKDAAGGAFEVVVFLKMDRLGRSTRLILNHAHELDNLGVGIVLIEQNIDTKGPYGRFFFTLMAAVAELERDMITDRMSGGKVGAVKKGKYLAATTPYGYVKVNGQLEVDPVTGPIVQQMFAWANEGVGVTTIAERLNDAKVTIPRPERATTTDGWTGPGVYRILTADRYTGQATYKSWDTKRKDGKVVERTTTAATPMPCPPLVSVEDFEGARDAMASRRRYSSRSTRTWYMLQHHIYCRRCQAAGRLDSRYSAQTNPYREYVCRWRKVHKDATDHDNVKWRVRADDVEREVKVWLIELLSNPKAVLARAEMTKDRSKSRSQEASDEVARLRAKLVALDEELAGAMDFLVRGRITEEFFDRAQGRITADKDQTEAALAEAEAAVVESLSQRERAQAIEDFLSGDVVKKMNGELKGIHRAAYIARVMRQEEPWKELVDLFIERVFVEADGRVTVQGKVPNFSSPP